MAEQVLESDAYTVLRVLRDKYVGWAFQHEIAERTLIENDCRYRFLSNSDCVAEWGREPPLGFGWGSHETILYASGVVTSVFHNDVEILRVAIKGVRHPCSRLPILLSEGQHVTSSYDMLYVIRDIKYQTYFENTWHKTTRANWQLSLERIAEGYPEEHWMIETQGE